MPFTSLLSLYLFKGYCAGHLLPDGGMFIFRNELSSLNNLVGSAEVGQLELT